MKQLLRTPLKTAITFLLLFLTVFALSARILEFRETHYKIRAAAEVYRGIGWAEISPAEAPAVHMPFYMQADPRMPKSSGIEVTQYAPLSMKQIRSIVEAPEISSYDLRVMTAGVSDRYYRLDEGKHYYNYTNRLVVEATLTDVEYGNRYNGVEITELSLSDCVLLAGNPNDFLERENIKVQSRGEKIPSHQNGGFWNVLRASVLYDDTFEYDSDYIRKHPLNQRYVFVLRYASSEGKYEFFLGDHLTNNWCEAMQSVEGMDDHYLEQEAFATLNKLIKLTNDDVRTLDVVYTEDMASIRRFNEWKMQIVEGRILTKDDHLQGKKVGVISRPFASFYHLKVGDYLSLNRGDALFETYKGLGAIAGSYERYSETYRPVTLKIVGIYDDVDEKNSEINTPNWSYSINTVFVPKALMAHNESNLESAEYSPSDFSFIVGNAWDISAFIQKIETLNLQTGTKISLQDNGWLEIEATFTQFKKIAGVSIGLLLVAIIVVIYFIAYLYIVRNKKVYAIMRALGTPSRKAMRHLLLPLMMVSVTAIGLGCYLGTFFTSYKMEGLEASRRLSTALLCFVFGCICLFFFAFWELKKLKKCSPLTLLQDHPTKVHESEAPLREVNVKIVSFKRRTSKSNHYMLRYVFKRLTRGGAKSLIFIGLTALLLSSVGLFLVMHQSTKALFSETVVKAKFSDGLPLQKVEEIIDRGYGKSVYYEYSYAAQDTYALTDIIVTNDIERYTGLEPQITFVSGYDIGSTKILGEVCLVGQAYMDANHLKLGDKINLYEVSKRRYLTSERIRMYRIQHPDDRAITDQEIINLYADQIEQTLSKKAIYYTIIGVVNTTNEQYNQSIFMPGTDFTEPFLDKEVAFDFMEMTLADNYKLDAFRTFSETLAVDNISFFMDTEKIEQVKRTLETLETLYPLFIRLPILIGGILGLLTSLMSSREIAVLRLLGTRRKATTFIFVLEHICLCFMGLLVGVVSLCVYNVKVFWIISKQLFYIYSGYLCFAMLCVGGMVWVLSNRHTFKHLQG